MTPPFLKLARQGVCYLDLRGLNLQHIPLLFTLLLMKRKAHQACLAVKRGYHSGCSSHETSYPKSNSRADLKLLSTLLRATNLAMSQVYINSCSLEFDDRRFSHYTKEGDQSQLYAIGPAVVRQESFHRIDREACSAEMILHCPCREV